MKIKINAKRWDKPIIFECDEVTIKSNGGNKVLITPQPDNGTVQFELNPEYGETVEVIA